MAPQDGLLSKRSLLLSLEYVVFWVVIALLLGPTVAIIRVALCYVAHLMFCFFVFCIVGVCFVLRCWGMYESIWVLFWYLKYLFRHWGIYFNICVFI